MSNIDNSGEKNAAALYILLTVLALAIALPLAVATSKSEGGDLFVECFGGECDESAQIAELKD